MFSEINSSSNIIFFFNSFLFWYTVTIILVYLILLGFSILGYFDQYKNTRDVNFDHILRSPLSPKIGIITSAFNEGVFIVDNIRSLISLIYNNFEIVIVNDGSTDNSLTKMIDAFDLIITDQKPINNLSHVSIKNIYRSRNKVFHNLMVIDKVNSGKSDSLNAGINFTDADYVVNLDVDCVIRQNSLLKMIEPILREVDSVTIATGGFIRISNNCEVINGRITKVILAKKWLPLFQTLEYLRNFVLGRMSFGYFNGLFIVSGAFGLFDKKILVEVGGYNKNTVGEDMELLFRMRKLMEDKKIKYNVKYISDPVCWTEVPDSLNLFIRQRSRWTRGKIETLSIHKKIMFNPRYGIFGLVSYPFLLIFEWLSSIIEFLGLIYVLILIIFGWIDWDHFLLIFGLVYSFSVMFSLYSIFIEEITYRRYKGFKSLFKLIGVSFLEPIFFYPINLFSSVKGNWDKFILRKNSWGIQVRRGFDNTNK